MSKDKKKKHSFGAKKTSAKKAGFKIEKSGLRKSRRDNRDLRASKDRESSNGGRKDLLEAVCRYFFSADKPSTYKDVCSFLCIDDMSSRQRIIDLLLKLVQTGYLKEAEHGKYILADRSGGIEGIVKVRRGGGAIIEPKNGGEEIMVGERNMNKAAVGDTVKVSLFATKPDCQPEGEVIEVVKRAREEFVGRLQIRDSYAFLLVDNKIMGNDIFIPKEKLAGGKEGMKAIVKVIDWAEKGRNPVGEVVELLGESGENNAEMNAILVEYGLPYSYPAEIEQTADQISDEIPQEEIDRRLDMRTVPTFTIDPKDAKDFDDALSIRRLDNGNWEVGIHIADVTYYVRPNDIVDKEAQNRATSVYLVDRTIPMLPERLCNKVCSLRPDEEKLCFSVIVEMDEAAKVLKRDIRHTVIKSARRFTYEEAQDVIEKKEGDMRDEILQLDKLAKIMRKERFDHGAIEFESQEVRFEIDENGKPLSVYFKESKDANKLIEEFMLLANKIVAEHIGKVKSGENAKTFVYRIHDNPDPEKLSNLASFISRFGYKVNLNGKGSDVSTSINHLLDDIRGKKEQNLIQTITVRSMAKAVYSVNNVGHYGLAFDYYTHFTSPIRRYPDMMVHRLLDRYAAGEKSADRQTYEDLCDHCSAQEKLAADAERASIKYKQVEFMKDKLGQIYDGVISGVTEWGIYVELNENKCEGMIPMRDLDDDYYTFDEKSYCIVGRRRGRKFMLGDEVVVRIARADLDKKQLDYELVEKK